MMFIFSALFFSTLLVGSFAKQATNAQLRGMSVDEKSLGKRILSAGAQEDNRLIAYLGNWHACPTAQQLEEYTHVIISFAVSYTWSPGKNICSTTCEISTPPICGNSPNPGLVSDLQAAGKKVILSFGGAGMGGSWDGNNDCWEYCFGREDHVVNRITDIVNELHLDGVDIDYEYFYEDNQNGSGFTKGAQAQKFLKDVTLGLREKLPAGSEITHAPMEPDIVPGTAYYDILVEVSDALDFLMPQYYNGFTRPAIDGIDPSGGHSALEHYDDLVDGIFDGDATKIVFGFCIADCSGTGSNANANQAASVMTELNTYHPCNGGAFFWVADDDRQGAWSGTVADVLKPSRGCSSGGGQPTAPTTPRPTRAPVASPPTQAPVAVPVGPTAEGTCGGGSIGNGLCENPAYCCSKWGYCGSGSVYCDTDQRPTGPSPETSSPTKSPTKQTTLAPTNPPTTKPVTSSPTRQPTLAPTNSPTTKPVTSSPTSRPSKASVETSAPTMKASTSKPSASPTKAPVSSPTGGGNSGCCSQNFKDCDVPEGGWCNNVERCGKPGSCQDYIWLENGALTDTSTCIKRWDGGCYGDFDCCDGLYCDVSSPYWKSCQYKAN